MVGKGENPGNKSLVPDGSKLSFQDFFVFYLLGILKE